MSRFNLVFLFLFFQSVSGFCNDCSAEYASDDLKSYRQDTLEKQILYNGRVWRNLSYKVLGDQFLFTKDFLPGSVTISGREFTDLSLKYDIYNDQLLAVNSNHIIIQLNKEMIDCFALEWNNSIYRFQRLDPDSLNSLSGFVNVLVDGNTCLYVKYRKEIIYLSVDNKSDMFEQMFHSYLKKDGKIQMVNGRRDFYKILSDRKQQIKSFIKTNNINVYKKEPASFIPVVEYYNKPGQ